MHLKELRGQLSDYLARVREGNEVEALYEQLDLVEITKGLLGDAGALAECFGLCGYDAVHLASAQLVNDPEMVLAAGDQQLLGAARVAGIATAQAGRGC